jgi:hypothetical protein
MALTSVQPWPPGAALDPAHVAAVVTPASAPAPSQKLLEAHASATVQPLEQAEHAVTHVKFTDRPVLRFLEQNFAAILGVTRQPRPPGVVGATAPRAGARRSSGRVSVSALPPGLQAQLRSRDVVTQRLLGALHGSLQTDEYARAAMQVGGRASRG